MRRDRLYVAAIVLLIVSGVAHIPEVATRGVYTRSGDLKAGDFSQFYVMGWLARSAEPSVLYNTRAHLQMARQRIDPGLDKHAPYPNYGPQVAWLFAPLSFLRYQASLGIFTLLSAWAYLAAIWVLAHGLTWFQREWKLLWLLAAASPAFLATLRFGQLSTFSLLLLALAVEGLRRRDGLLTGMALGGLAFKPSLLVVIGPALVLAQDWRCVLGLLLASVTQFAAGWLVAGTESMSAYLHVLLTLAADPDKVILFPEIAHSTRGFLRLAGLPAAPASAASLVVLGLMVPLAARVWRGSGEPLVRLGFLTAATVLATPHLLTYDLLLLTVPLLAAIDRALTDASARPSPLCVATLIAVYLGPFSPVVAKWTGLQMSTVAIALLVVGLWRIARPDESAVP